MSPKSMSSNISWNSSSAAVSNHHDIFISYSRRDKEFVRKLWAKLTEYNQNVWVDWEDIPPGQDWRQEIYQGIEASHHFVFIISSYSLNSAVCGEELAYAIKHGKRLLPIVREEGNFEKIHPELARLNWIFCRETDDFEQAVQTIITAIKIDIEYVRKHTWILIRARDWEKSGHDKSFLLWGKELEQAQQWLAQSADKNPQPTPLHLAYLHACQQAEQERAKAELLLQQMTPQQYRNRQALINKVRNFWIDGVLKTSIQGKNVIPLEIEERYFSTDHLEAVPPFMPSETTVTGIFDRLGEGRTLLILGEPGAGKTTMLLELGRKLIDRADKGLDDRIPVIFNLSSWGRQRQPIEIWLIEELNNKYQVPREIGQAWVKQQQLLLLLDGLDEVKTEYRQICVDALNIFNQNHAPEIVVCCRIEDYHILSRPLNFQKAIYLRSLSLRQVRSYLATSSDELTGLKASIEADPDLQELACSPLMLNLMTLAYQGSDASDLSVYNFKQENLRHLFDTYIERMLQRRGADLRYNKTQVKRWLAWLAQQMSRSSQTIFFIERMQSELLNNKKQNNIYKLSNFLTIIIIVLFIIFLDKDIFELPLIKLIYGIVIGTIVAMVILRDQETIKLHKTICWSWKKAQKSLKKGFVYGLTGIIIYTFSNIIISSILKLFFTELNHRGFLQQFLAGLSWGLAGMLIFCPIYTLIGGLGGAEIQTKSVPNQGIWKTLLNAGIGVLIGVIVGLLVGGVIFGLGGQLLTGLNFGLIFGSIFGFFCGGGTACIQHLTLRTILCINGYIPWNYSRFLDYGTERIFLRKVGGGYIFIHRFLLEHFAQMDF